MAVVKDPSLLKSVKGKVLLGFLVASIALAASWVISKKAFDDMLNKLEVLSTPSNKLRLVNIVFKNILALDQLQSERTAKGDTTRAQILAQSTQLVIYIDSLSGLFLDSPHQITRLDSMKNILRNRENLYGNYVKVRTKLVSNQALSDQVKSISGLITNNKKKPDSTVVKTEKRVTTTTVYTETPDTSAKLAEEKKGFLNRVFGSKKNKKPVVVAPPKIIQKQEVNVQVDTLKVVREDSTIDKVGEAVHAIETSQKLRTNSFIDREQQLTTAGTSLVRQLLRVMKEVEADVVRQSNKDGFAAQKMVSSTVTGLEWVMIGFFFLTAVLSALIFADISRSNRYRSQLEEAKEEAEYHSMAKQRFLSNMSHEIRTPLQSIIGYAEVLKKSEKPKQQDLETLHAASEHLLYLVNDVLDYSRIISDQFSFEERIFAISPLLNEVIQMLRPTSVAKSLVLSLENTLPDDLYLKGDPFRIRQVLYNLLTNAIKFTDIGEVVLRVTGVDTKKGFQLGFEVSDTGIGLSEEQMQRVFNQFEQADPTIARRYGGTGLGLSIVKALVEGMSGTVEVKSKQGAGTTFIVKTMLKKGETPMAVAEQPGKDQFSYSGKVWLVDDDAFILKWCSSILEMHHVEHMTFGSAEEALNHPWDNEVNVVLTDMRMPGINGAELSKRLRKLAAPGVRFYVLTAQALPEERSMLMKLGFDGILMKPFHSHELLELLKQNPLKLPLPAKTELDFSALNEMTFGDESLLREILDQFVKDTRADLESLKISVAAKNTHNISELAHKLAGRTGQIGISGLSEKFRKIEISFRGNDSQSTMEEVSAVASEAATIIDQVEEKALTYSI